MYSPLSYKPSFSVFAKTWIVEHLERLHGSLYRYLVDDIVSTFDKQTLLYNQKIKRIERLSPEQAQYKLIGLKQVLRSYERLDISISEIENFKIKSSFKELKKSVFKYEARLHRIATSENPIEKTPDSIKIMLSTFSKKVAV